MLLESSSSNLCRNTTRFRRNEATQVLPALDMSSHRPDAFRQVFLRLYEQVRPLLVAEDEPAYVLLGSRGHADDGELLVLPLQPGQCSDAIAGRHDRCDLVLAADPAVALRHVLIRAFLDAEGHPRIRLLDLCSRTGFLDESGKPCTGLSSDGHLFVSLGSYRLLALQRMPGQRWPADAARAWESLPERQLSGSCVRPRRCRRPLELRPRLRVVDPAEARSHRHDQTTITRLPGPVHLQQIEEAAGEGETEALASLIFPRQQGDLCVQLTAEELADGVLVGRYERCQLGTWALAPSSHISRVHLCLLLDETGLWAIDTASSNGTKCDGQKLRSAKLGGSATLRLAHSLTVRWMLG